MKLVRYVYRVRSAGGAFSSYIFKHRVAVMLRSAYLLGYDKTIEEVRVFTPKSYIIDTIVAKWIEKGNLQGALGKQGNAAR